MPPYVHTTGDHRREWLVLLEFCRTMFFSSSDTHIFGLCILLLISYAISHNIGPISEVYTWLFQCFGYSPGPSSGTANSSPGPAQHSSKRRIRIHNLPLHLNSFRLRHIRHRYQPPLPYRPPPASLRPGVSKSGQPSKAPVSTPRHTATSVKVPLPPRNSAPHFDPAFPSTLQDYLYDYELLAEDAQLTPVDKLAKCTRYLERNVRMDWETLPEFNATPPDWKAFKAALFRDYPDAVDPEPSSADLDKFIEEHSHRNISSLSDFASFNRQFRRLTSRLLASGRVCQLEVQKAYTKSLNPELRRILHIYLLTEKVPHVTGEAYTVEQVREAAEYIFKGSDPRFESPSQASSPQDIGRCHWPTDRPVNDQTARQSPAHPLKLPMDHLSTAASVHTPLHAEVHQPDDRCHRLGDQTESLIQPWQDHPYLHSTRRKASSTVARAPSPRMASSLNQSCDKPRHYRSPQPENTPAHTPASPVPMSHVPAAPYPPQAQPPNPHALKVPHLVSGSHAPAHFIRASPTLVVPPASPILHVPSGLHTGHTLHTPAKPGAPYEAKKARSVPESDRLLDAFIRQLENKVTSTGHGDLRPNSGPHGLHLPKCPSSPLPHSSSSGYVPLRPAGCRLPSQPSRSHPDRHCSQRKNVIQSSA